MSLAPDLKPRSRTGTKSTEQADGQLMLERADRVVIINALGAVVWDFCDGDTSLSQITAAIARQFPGVPPRQVEMDVEQLLVRLRDQGFVELSPC